MGKWLAGILGTVISGVVIWWITTGMQPPPSVPPSTSPAAPVSTAEPPPPPAPTPVRCEKPTPPVLISPGDNHVVANHYYGQGSPWEFEWLPSGCEGGAIQGYRIVIRFDGAARPAVDEVVNQPNYKGNTGGTVTPGKWTWKVQAIDDRNQLSDWSEERPFIMARWQN